MRIPTRELDKLIPICQGGWRGGKEREGVERRGVEREGKGGGGEEGREGRG